MKLPVCKWTKVALWCQIHIKCHLYLWFVKTQPHQPQWASRDAKSSDNATCHSPLWAQASMALEQFSCKNWKTMDIHTMDDVFHKCWTLFAGPGDEYQQKDSYYKYPDIPWLCLQLKVNFMLEEGMNRNEQNVTVPTKRTSYWDTHAGHCLHIRPPHPWESAMIYACGFENIMLIDFISTETGASWSIYYSLSWRWSYQIL